MNKLPKKYKYKCTAPIQQWGGKKWVEGDFITDVEYNLSEYKSHFEPVELTTRERFVALMKGMQLSYEDVASITGNTVGSIKAVLSSGKVPNWVNLAIWMYEIGQYKNPVLQQVVKKIITENK